MKIKGIYNDLIVFDNDTTLESYHDQDCCESHYADFSSLVGQGWEGKEFPEHLSDLVSGQSSIPDSEGDFDSWRSFFHIQDLEGNRYTVTIYNSNNGYYSTNVTLILTNKNVQERLHVQ